MYLNSYDFKNAYIAFKKVLELHPKETYIYKISKIGVADGLEGIGRTKEAIETVTWVLKSVKEKEKVLKGICYQARGEYYFRAGNLKKAKSDFEASKKLFLTESRTHDIAHLAKWFGALYFLEKKYKFAEKELQFAYEILNHPGSQPISIISLLYWLEKLPGFDLPLGLKIPLRAHHVFSPYGFLVGRRFNSKNLIPLHPWIKAQYKSTENDCWVISDGKIFSVRYCEYIKDAPLKFKNKAIWDLFSGIHFNDSEKNNTLTDIQVMCLYALIGAGDLGINEWTLMDFMYRQEFIDPMLGVNRLKKLIKQLSMKGIQITRKKNYYFYKLNLKTVIVLPMDINYQGPVFYLKALMDEFNRKDVEKIFNAAERTARVWINNWMKKSIIFSKGQGRSISYKFIAGL